MTVSFVRPAHSAASFGRPSARPSSAPVFITDRERPAHLLTTLTDSDVAKQMLSDREQAPSPEICSANRFCISYGDECTEHQVGLGRRRKPMPPRFPDMN